LFADSLINGVVGVVGTSEWGFVADVDLLGIFRIGGSPEMVGIPSNKAL
jgi:hypothetical protein